MANVGLQYETISTAGDTCKVLIKETNRDTTRFQIETYLRTLGHTPQHLYRILHPGPRISCLLTFQTYNEAASCIASPLLYSDLCYYFKGFKFGGGGATTHSNYALLIDEVYSKNIDML